MKYGGTISLTPAPPAYKAEANAAAFIVNKTAEICLSVISTSANKSTIMCPHTIDIVQKNSRDNAAQEKRALIYSR